jgi:cytoskeletal protein RodZ
MLGTSSSLILFNAPRVGTRFTLKFLVAAMIISTLFTLINIDNLQAASTIRTDTSNYHSSIQPVSEASLPSLSMSHSSSSSTPTAQAALQIPRTFQSTDIVNSKAIYEVMFITSTTGAIDKIRMDFPASTNIDAAGVIEKVGIGGGSLLKSGSSISYDVTTPVSVPAGTFIRLEISGIKNPAVPSGSFSATITTRDSGGNLIDGPTPTNVYAMKQIGTEEIAGGSITGDKVSSSFMGSRLLQDNPVGHSFGWNPDGIATDFIIIDDVLITGSNPVLINVGDTGSNSQCESLGSLTGFFTIQCLNPPPQGSELRYTVVNLALL